MDNQKLLAYIAELEARLIVAELFVNEVNKTNSLKVPPDHAVQSELAKQRGIAKAKYDKLANS